MEFVYIANYSYSLEKHWLELQAIYFNTPLTLCEEKKLKYGSGRMKKTNLFSTKSVGVELKNTQLQLYTLL